MTDVAPRQATGARQVAESPLTLKYVPPYLDEEPAFRDDPLMEWSHEPEPPPSPRVGNQSWPPGIEAHPRS